ncbi:unnamed protein product, partial [Musa acuminata var. zebrina]
MSCSPTRAPTTPPPPALSALYSSMTSMNSASSTWTWSLSPRFHRSTLFVDVLSVKEFPRNLFLQRPPRHFDILCTHPMFGPESSKHGWAGLPFVHDRVRIGDSE